LLVSCKSLYWFDFVMISAWFCLAVVNLTLVDLPGLTKVAVGNFYYNFWFSKITVGSFYFTIWSSLPFFVLVRVVNLHIWICNETIVFCRGTARDYC
jgi:hypothetical protein